jgi:hypothetical protein
MDGRGDLTRFLDGSSLFVLPPRGWPGLSRCEGRGCSTITTDIARLWQARYYDVNVWSERKRVEKLGDIHRNPVKRGLVEKPEDWRWSSFRHHVTGEDSVVEIEPQWAARKRERMGIYPTIRTPRPSQTTRKAGCHPPRCFPHAPVQMPGRPKNQLRRRQLQKLTAYIRHISTVSFRLPQFGHSLFMATL